RRRRPTRIGCSTSSFRGSSSGRRESGAPSKRTLRTNLGARAARAAVACPLQQRRRTDGIPRDPASELVELGEVLARARGTLFARQLVVLGSSGAVVSRRFAGFVEHAETLAPARDLGVARAGEQRRRPCFVVDIALAMDQHEAEVRTREGVLSVTCL